MQLRYAQRFIISAGDLLVRCNARTVSIQYLRRVPRGLQTFRVERFEIVLVKLGLQYRGSCGILSGVRFLVLDTPWIGSVHTANLRTMEVQRNSEICRRHSVRLTGELAGSSGNPSGRLFQK